MCKGTLMNVAILEDGHAEVNLPVENAADVKAVRLEPELGPAVQALLAGEQVRIYGAPGSMMVGVCIEMLSDEEKQNRDAEYAAREQANVQEVHDLHVNDAQAEVDAAKELVDNAGPDSAEERAQRLADAEAALADAQKARDAALKEVERG